MPSEVYNTLVRAGYKGTEQQMFRTFLLDGITTGAINNWTIAYNLLMSSTIAGDVLTSNGAGVPPTWQTPSSGGGNSYFPSGW